MNMPAAALIAVLGVAFGVQVASAQSLLSRRPNGPFQKLFKTPAQVEAQSAGQARPPVPPRPDAPAPRVPAQILEALRNMARDFPNRPRIVCGTHVVPADPSLDPDFAKPVPEGTFHLTVAEPAALEVDVLRQESDLRFERCQRPAGRSTVARSNSLKRSSMSRAPALSRARISAAPSSGY